MGGYGRREMLPYSDVDIMILSEDDITAEQEKLISTFISSLWDVGNFKPGISVRTIYECVEQATNDLTVATALIESRLISGNRHLAKWPRRIVSQTWTDKTFLMPKWMSRQSAMLSTTILKVTWNRTLKMRFVRHPRYQPDWLDCQTSLPGQPYL